MTAVIEQWNSAGFAFNVRGTQQFEAITLLHHPTKLLQYGRYDAAQAVNWHDQGGLSTGFTMSRLEYTRDKRVVSQASPALLSKIASHLAQEDSVVTARLSMLSNSKTVTFSIEFSGEWIDLVTITPHYPSPTVGSDVLSGVLGTVAGHQFSNIAYRTCTQLQQKPGGLASSPAKSCRQLQHQWGLQQSGMHYIQPSQQSIPVSLWCDMQLLGGGWELIMTRAVGKRPRLVTGHTAVSPKGSPAALPTDLWLTLRDSREQVMVVARTGTDRTVFLLKMSSLLAAACKPIGRDLRDNLISRGAALVAGGVSCDVTQGQHGAGQCRLGIVACVYFCVCSAATDG